MRSRTSPAQASGSWSWRSRSSMCAGSGDASWDGGGGGPTSDSPGSGTPPFGAFGCYRRRRRCSQEPPFLNKAFRRLAISDDASIVRRKGDGLRARPGSRASPLPGSPNINALRPWAAARAA